MNVSVRAESHDDDTVIITLAGQVQFHNAAQIPGAVHAAIVRWAPKAVFIDVAAVTSLDAAGIGALLASGKAAASVSVSVVVINPEDRLYRQLQARQVADLLCPHLALIEPGQPVATG